MASPYGTWNYGAYLAHNVCYCCVVIKETMHPARARALAELARLAAGKEARRDALASVFRAATRAGALIPEQAMDTLRAEADAAAWHRARADGLTRGQADRLGAVARKRAGGLLT